MFELTDSMTYTVPLISLFLTCCIRHGADIPSLLYMLSILVAKTLADVLEPKGIYDLVIELNQLPYLDAKHEYLWGSLQVNDVVRSYLESTDHPDDLVLYRLSVTGR